MITGPSGVGKSTVVDALADRIPLHFSVSVTTRPARKGERPGEDYHFVDDRAFDTMVGDGALLEWAEYSGHRYGTPREEVERRLANGETVVLDIELHGAGQVQETHPEAVVVFLTAPSDAEMERRLRARGDTDEAEVERRLDIARSQLAQAGRFRHVVVNDRVERAVDEILRILSER